MERRKVLPRYQGKTLGKMVLDQAKLPGQEQALPQEQRRSRAFQNIGLVMQDFFDGKIKFFSTGRVKVSGDPAKILALCDQDGLSIHDLRLKGRSQDEILAISQELIADLSYLLLKGAIAAEPIGYVPPDYKGVASLIDVQALTKKFPDLAGWLAVGQPRPGDLVKVGYGILAVDAVVVILDVVQVSYDRPIDLIGRS